MLFFLRIFFPALFATCLFLGSRLASANAGDALTLAEVAYIFASVIFALGAGLVWAPFVGEKIAQPVTEALTGAACYPYETCWMKLARWMARRGHRRMTLCLCLLEGLEHPTWPGAFVLGMSHARPGSWLERHFARNVYAFENAHNCVRAYEVLKRRGETPPRHPVPEIQFIIDQLEKGDPLPMERAPIPLGVARVTPLQRNPQIKLFSDAETAPVRHHPPAGHGTLVLPDETKVRP